MYRESFPVCSDIQVRLKFHLQGLFLSSTQFTGAFTWLLRNHTVLVSVFNFLNVLCSAERSLLHECFILSCKHTVMYGPAGQTCETVIYRGAAGIWASSQQLKNQVSRLRLLLLPETPKTLSGCVHCPRAVKILQRLQILHQSLSADRNKNRLKSTSCSWCFCCTDAWFSLR